jgi:hypothetical protein
MKNWIYRKTEEYQKEKNYVSGDWSAAGAWGRQLYRHLSTDCVDNMGSLPSYRHPRPVTGIVFLFLLYLALRHPIFLFSMNGADQMPYAFC